MKPRVLVTCGPSYEPIDQVRRLTNFSTGELGVLLAAQLAEAGFDVTCFKGEGATYPGPAAPVEVVPFSTNDHLGALLQAAVARQVPRAVLHAAALCDFRVARMEAQAGAEFTPGKLSSRSGGLQLHLKPARKLISELRTLCPSAWIAGWKYEVDGPPAEAQARAWRQIAECRTDACVLNGPAVGQGFLVCLPPDRIVAVAGKTDLAAWLARQLAGLGAGR